MTGEAAARRPRLGWSLVGGGLVLVLVGAILLVGPGPGWVVLWLGVLTMAAGLLLARAR